MYERPSDSNFDDVGRFHTKFGLPANEPDTRGEPREFTKEMVLFRAKFLLEEVEEFCEAAGLRIILDEMGKASVEDTYRDGAVDHPQAFDALLDVTYVAMGTAHLFGYPWQAGWDEVQRANMTKVRAQSSGESKRGTSLDVVKPDGWTPPDIDRILGSRGFSPYGIATDGNRDLAPTPEDNA